MDEIKVTKYGTRVPVSCCVMTDATGVNHCKHPAPPPLSRWQRLRYRARSWWYDNAPRIHRGPCDVDPYDD